MKLKVGKSEALYIGGEEERDDRHMVGWEQSVLGGR